MPCYHPIPASQASPGQRVKLLPPIGEAHLLLPCGKCLGCRAARAREWGERCRHEAACHDFNTFVTLTYDDAHLPAELMPGHLAEFVRAVRQAVRRGDDSLLSDRSRSVRFFASGEYGDINDRPHYHMIFFNLGCADKQIIAGDEFFSARLTELWSRGSVRCGSVSGRSASYVAGYTAKKLSCDRDGVVRQGPFLRCSRKPGIGLPWVRTYAEDLARGSVVTVDGQEMPIPRYYRKLLAGSATLESAEFRVHERSKGRDRSAARLEAAEKVHQSLVSLKGSRSL